MEFALIAPVAFLMVFAIMEFGRLIMALHGIEHAAREGCRTAISWRASAEDATQTVAACLRGYRITD